MFNIACSFHGLLMGYIQVILTGIPSYWCWVGLRLAAALAEGFRGIAQVVGRIEGGGAGAPVRVTLTLTPVFAAQWLMPGLKRFWAAHPDAPISLRPEKRLADLPREAVDLGIRFGNCRQCLG